MDASYASELEIRLHPLVLFEISQHCTQHFVSKAQRCSKHRSSPPRACSAGPEAAQAVDVAEALMQEAPTAVDCDLETRPEVETPTLLCGAVLGDSPSPSLTHLRTSFPLPAPRGSRGEGRRRPVGALQGGADCGAPGASPGEPAGAAPALDLEFCRDRMQQFLATHSGLSLVALYVVCTDVRSPTPLHASLRQQVAPLSGGDVALLLFDPTALAKPQEVAPAQPTEDFLAAYATAERVAAALRGFRKLRLDITMDEMERITLDYVMNQAASASAESAEYRYRLQIARQKQALEDLLRRVMELRDYVAEVRAGTRPRDEPLLRSIMAFCRRMCVAKSLPASFGLSPSPQSALFSADSISCASPPSCPSLGSADSADKRLTPSSVCLQDREKDRAGAFSDAADVPADSASSALNPGAAAGADVPAILRDLAFLTDAANRREGGEEAAREALVNQMTLLLSSMTEAVDLATRTHEKFLLSQAAEPSGGSSSLSRHGHFTCESDCLDRVYREVAGGRMKRQDAIEKERTAHASIHSSEAVVSQRLQQAYVETERGDVPVLAQGGLREIQRPPLSR
ncbi:hypothetical protein BESB_058930 [Besnoitia besnoiti]|uniref:EIF3F/CSN6-like C-terminal domain-containing protein n=1 Tax=Besnoitia besnoiti TaxID=94643 RepID=A0A2A9MGA9_BESBE|nr:hypothetical protein BESB_058930 [Besnoitia besnoiti]PFH35006.1 hypothetical protein BESB_058930 [Besnoitia besnoiti]